MFDISEVALKEPLEYEKNKSRIMSAFLCLFQLWEVRGAMPFARTIVPGILSSLSGTGTARCFLVLCSLPSQLSSTQKLKYRRTRTKDRREPVPAPRATHWEQSTDCYLFASRACCKGTDAQHRDTQLGRCLQSPTSQVWGTSNWVFSFLGAGSGGSGGKECG